MIDKQFLALRYWPTWLGLALLRVFSLLPLPVIHGLGVLLGKIFYGLIATRRNIALRNVSACLPEKSSDEHVRIVKQNFEEISKALLTTGFNWWASEKRMRAYTHRRGWHHFEQAKQAGENVILLAPHFLSLETGGMMFSLDHSVVGMYQRPRNELIRPFLVRGRSRFKGSLVERGGKLRELIRLIRTGEPFYYLPDQAPGSGQGVFAPFFGIQTATFSMLGKFAKLGNAKVIPFVSLQLPNGRGYEVILKPPFENFPTGDEVKDAATMNEKIAEIVREYPEQYFWVHKRFKTQPEGEPDFYQPCIENT